MSGVAAVAASTLIKPSEEVVLVFTNVETNGPKLVTSIARAANAGFKKLPPKPPKSCFISIIAITLPKQADHQGAVEGRLSANKSPVTTRINP